MMISIVTASTVMSYALYKQSPQSARRNNCPGEQISRWFLVRSENLSASNYPGAAYTVSEETMQRFQTRGLLLTLPFVLYGIFRYLYLVYHENQGEDPTQSLLTDRSMVINLCLWALTVGVIVYWR
jgi:hypothetical protein